MPFSSGDSSREPVFIQIPMAMERMWAISSLSTIRPLGRISRLMLRGSVKGARVRTAVSITGSHLILTHRKWSHGELYVLMNQQLNQTLVEPDAFWPLTCRI